MLYSKYSPNYVRIANALHLEDYVNNPDPTLPPDQREFLPFDFLIPNNIIYTNPVLRFTTIACRWQDSSDPDDMKLIPYFRHFECRNMHFQYDNILLPSGMTAFGNSNIELGIQGFLWQDPYNYNVYYRLYTTKQLYLQNIEFFSDEFDSNEYWLNPDNPNNILDLYPEGMPPLPMPVAPEPPAPPNVAEFGSNYFKFMRGIKDV